ncbi:hypothetical protein EUTSA_v10000505mg, partial [Eutrema salsugineum]
RLGTTSSSSSSLRVTKRKKMISDGSDLLPIDLVIEIFIRLPVKTLARFLCLSKIWKSTIRSRYFKKLYIAESSSSSNRHRPRSLIFSLRRDGHECFYFSSLQTKNPSGEATYHLSHPTNKFTINSSSIHGFICYGTASKARLYNTIKRRSIALPMVDSKKKLLHQFLGYDPIDGVYKLLCMTTGKKAVAKEIQVLTLGKETSWRKIETCAFVHSPHFPQICIDGVLYYGAYYWEGRKERGVVSFDVRSESFHLVKAPKGIGMKFTKMTRFNGKLALMYTGHRRIELWVLVDAAKHEWCNESFPMPRITGCRGSFEAFCAIDETGEFVLAPREFTETPFCVVYYHPMRGSVRKVDFQGITEQVPPPSWGLCTRNWRTMSIFPNQVENLLFL